jgi:hypothetical protein
MLAWDSRKEVKETNLYIVTLKIGAVCFSETMISARKTTRCRSPENHNLNCQEMPCYSTPESLKWKTE